MPYHSNIPQAGDTKAASQPLILDNFQYLNNLVLGINNFIVLPEQAPGVPVVPALTLGLYTRHVGASTALFIGNSAGAEVDITTSLNAIPGWCRLPCGLVMKWGVSDVCTGSGDYTIAMIDVPAITPLNIQLTPGSGTDTAPIVNYKSWAGGAQTVTFHYHLGNHTDTFVRCLIIGI